MLYYVTLLTNVSVVFFNCMLSIYFTSKKHCKYDNQLFYTACIFTIVAVIMDIVCMMEG